MTTEMMILRDRRDRIACGIDERIFGIERLDRKNDLIIVYETVRMLAMDARGRVQVRRDACKKKDKVIGDDC